MYIDVCLLDFSIETKYRKILSNTNQRYRDDTLAPTKERKESWMTFKVCITEQS